MSGDLRALAKAATPGPWVLIGGGEYLTPVGILVAPDDGGVTDADAAYIAAANPAAILALLDERDALAAKVARVEALADTLQSEAEPYVYGGSRFDKVSDTLAARADCRWMDAERIRAALKDQS